MAIVTPLLVMVTCYSARVLTEARPLGTTIIRVRHVELHPTPPPRHLHHHHHHYYHPGSQPSPPATSLTSGPYPPSGNTLTEAFDSYMPQAEPGPPALDSARHHLPDSFLPQPLGEEGIALPESYMPVPVPTTVPPPPSPASPAVEVFQFPDPARSPRDSYLPEPAPASYSPPTPSTGSSSLTSSYYINSASPESPVESSDHYKTLPTTR